MKLHLINYFFILKKTIDDLTKNLSEFSSPKDIKNNVFDELLNYNYFFVYAAISITRLWTYFNKSSKKIFWIDKIKGLVCLELELQGSLF